MVRSTDVGYQQTEARTFSVEITPSVHFDEYEDHVAVTVMPFGVTAYGKDREAASQRAFVGIRHLFEAYNEQGDLVGYVLGLLDQVEGDTVEYRLHEIVNADSPSMQIGLNGALAHA